MTEDGSTTRGKRTEFAEERTDWAEDRTLMANERTFAGWLRTGLAAVGIGFNALFSKLQPDWLPKALASAFIAVGLLIFWLARAKAALVLRRLSSHCARPVPATQINLISLLLMVASAGLMVGIWLI